MTPPMIETFVALFLAHLIADFVTQTTWMVRHKQNPGVLALHGLHVFVLTALALGGSLALALGIAISHILIDAVKLRFLPQSLAAFLGDQTAHLAVLLAVVFLVPEVMANGFWGALPAEILTPAILLSGLILATLAGDPAVGLLMAPYKDITGAKGLENAGRTIGLLERALIYLMIMIGEPTGIGFLIAAKSILRFDTVSRDRQVSEYVIIGTLASFGWALAASFATTAALRIATS